MLTALTLTLVQQFLQPVHFEPKALRFKGNGTASTEGVENRRRVASGRLEDFRFRFVQHIGVVAVFPQHQPFDDAKESLALRVLLGFCRELFWERGGVIYQ